MEDVQTSGAVLEKLRALGVRIAVDDFGTGYSSLSYLRSLPVDLLKIDRSFIMALQDGEAEAAIVRAVAALATALHLKVVAEGVETPAQLRALTALNVDFGQGYLWSRPVIEAEAAWTDTERAIAMHHPNVADLVPPPRAHAMALPAAPPGVLAARGSEAGRR